MWHICMLGRQVLCMLTVQRPFSSCSASHLSTRTPGNSVGGTLFQVQIGCHTDDLTRASKLFRGPLVINRCCLDKPTKSITCLWGGLLYIIVPQSSKLGSVPITVKGAVHAPFYKLGE